MRAYTIRAFILLVIVSIFISYLPRAEARQEHENVIKEKQDDKLSNYKLDLWIGKPNRPYTVIGDIEHEKYVSLRKGLGSMGISTAVYYLRIAAMNMNADAVINVNCKNFIGAKSPMDNGDFYEKANYLVTLETDIECLGTAVKYK